MIILKRWLTLLIFGSALITTACGTAREEPGLPVEARTFSGTEQQDDSTPDSNADSLDSSGQRNETRGGYRAPRLDSVVIYCWCLKNGQSNCMTWAAVKPEELCDPEKKLYTMKAQQAADFRGLINSAETRKNVYGMPDARLVLQCFAKDSVFLLTYRTLEDHTLVVDDRRQLYCRQPVLQWIMEAMGVSEITCAE